MPDRNSDVRLDIGLGHSPAARQRDDSQKFRVALLGDFSGRASRKLPHRVGLVGVKPISIDPENFEEVMQRLGVELHLPTGAEPTVIRFSELDHFHPDHLYQTVPLLQSMRAASAELAKTASAPEQPKPIAAPVKPAVAKPASGLSFLDQIADATEEPEPELASKADLFDQAIRSIASRHATPKEDSRVAEVRTQVEATAAEALRLILSSSPFQSLEAAWRSVFLLLRHLETGVDLEVDIIDVSRAELLADLAAASDLASTGIWRVLMNGQENSWSVLAGLYSFSPNPNDCSDLARIGTLAEAVGAPFVAAMSPALFGCASIAETPDTDDWDAPVDPASKAAWDQLRALPQSRWLGLATPRFLLRLPYGKKTSPVESLAFEEQSNPPDHDAYLWGNPAVVVACLLGQAYQRSGWEMRPGSVNRLDDVPAHVHGDDDVTPSAEIWLTERFAERMLDEGVMPLASVKHSEAVQLVRVQSIAQPTQALAGPWGI